MRRPSRYYGFSTFPFLSSVPGLAPQGVPCVRRLIDILYSLGKPHRTGYWQRKKRHDSVKAIFRLQNPYISAKWRHLDCKFDLTKHQGLRSNACRAKRIQHFCLNGAEPFRPPPVRAINLSWFCKNPVDTKPRPPYMHRRCPDGGIGRRAGFRYLCREAWRFESSSGHHSLFKCLNYSGTLLFVSLDVPAVTLTVMVEAKNDLPPALTTDGA